MLGLRRALEIPTAMAEWTSANQHTQMSLLANWRRSLSGCQGNVVIVTEKRFANSCWSCIENGGGFQKHTTATLKLTLRGRRTYRVRRYVSRPRTKISWSPHSSAPPRPSAFAVRDCATVARQRLRGSLCHQVARRFRSEPQSLLLQGLEKHRRPEGGHRPCTHMPLLVIAPPFRTEASFRMVLRRHRMSRCTLGQLGGQHVPGTGPWTGMVGPGSQVAVVLVQARLQQSPARPQELALR